MPFFFSGFGPFGNHIVNASWIAVQEMEKLGLGNDVDLIIKEIPVEYKAVKAEIPDLWRQYKPDVSIINSFHKGFSISTIDHYCIS